MKRADPRRSSLVGGVLGRSGTPIASHRTHGSDLLVAFGANFNDHIGIAEYKPTIHADHDPTTLGNHHPVDAPVRGEIGVTIDRLLDALPATLAAGPRRAEVAERGTIRRDEKSTGGTNPPTATATTRLPSRSSPGLSSNAVMSVDVGNDTPGSGCYFEGSGQWVLMSGNLGSIGVAFPAAGGHPEATRKPDFRIAGRSCAPPVTAGSGNISVSSRSPSNGIGITHALFNDDGLVKIPTEQSAGDREV